MKSTLLVVLIFSAALALAPATDGRPVHNFRLSEPRDIVDAAAVNAALSVLVKDAASCPAGTSKDRQACACSFEDDLKKLKSAYGAAVAKHPVWNEENAVVAYRNAGEDTSTILSFPGIKRQLNACAQQKR
jgi:hypothetical protein